MFLAITTKFVPATDTKGARISVRVHGSEWMSGGSGRSHLHPYRHELTAEQNHQSAALKTLANALQSRHIRIHTADGPNGTRIHFCSHGSASWDGQAQYSDFWSATASNMIKNDNPVCSFGKWLDIKAEQHKAGSESN